MPCRFASSGTVATSRSASRAILALNVASNFLRDLVISVLHRLRQSRTLHTLTFGPISGVHFTVPVSFRPGRALMNVRITQIDGTLPNLALMRIAARHRASGDAIHFTRGVRREMFEPEYGAVYGSAIFKFSADRIDRFREQFPD